MLVTEQEKGNTKSKEEGEKNFWEDPRTGKKKRGTWRKKKNEQTEKISDIIHRETIKTNFWGTAKELMIFKRKSSTTS